MSIQLSGLMLEPATLIDERGRPDVRDVFGLMAAQSTSIACALTRIRLSAVDLTEVELDRVESFRVLVAEMNAIQLDGEARAVQADPRRAPRADLLSVMLESGRLEVRSAPLAGWCPDFSVFADERGPKSVLLGAHWFGRPYAHRGPALATIHGGDAARLAARRHAELWESAHDVGPAVWSILSKARRAGAYAGGLSG